MTIIPKLMDWRSRLDSYLATVTSVSLRYGAFDCALFGDGCFEAQTGVTFAADFRGKYSSLEEGLKMLRNAGFEDHVALMASKLPEIPPAFAHIGDFAVVDLGALGKTITVVGGHRLHGPMLGARGSVELTAASRAFAVGRQPDL